MEMVEEPGEGRGGGGGGEMAKVSGKMLWCLVSRKREREREGGEGRRLISPSYRDSVGPHHHPGQHGTPLAICERGGNP